MNCPKCEGEMWDNRVGKKNPKAPDFKCKDKDCDGVIWPPRGAKAAGNGTPRTQAAPQRANGGTSSDDRSNRIERQHSQEMAIRWFMGCGKIEDLADLKKLRAMIDYFQKDVGRMPQEREREPEIDEAPEPEGVEEPEGEEPF